MKTDDKDIGANRRKRGQQNIFCLSDLSTGLIPSKTTCNRWIIKSYVYEHIHRHVYENLPKVGLRRGLDNGNGVRHGTHQDHHTRVNHVGLVLGGVTVHRIICSKIGALQLLQLVAFKSLPAKNRGKENTRKVTSIQPGDFRSGYMKTEENFLNN